MKTLRSQELFSKAKTFFPGGVNSPVRAFRSVGGDPIFIESGKGARIKDADGNEYIDFCGSWGPLILGHANEKVISAIREVVGKGTSFGAPTALENQLAELIISNNPFIEKLRFVSSGTEAVMSAIRLARGFTGKNKIIKFEGCYHGHSDSLLVKAGSGLVTFGSSSSAGVPEPFVNETIVLPLDSEEALTEAFNQYKDQIACVILEAIPSNNGLLLQRKEYLEFLRTICTKNNTVLLFDEVITGFRIGFTGAAGYYNIKPDIITYGKIIGGGLPVGAYAASAEIMSHISPEGNVYQAGTLSGNPVAMTAGIAQLFQCLENGFYESLEKKTDKLTSIISGHRIFTSGKARLFKIGSIFWISFASSETVRKASEINAAGMKLFNTMYHFLLNNGIYLGPSGYEVGFVCAAHTDEEIDQAGKIFLAALDQVCEKHKEELEKE